MRSHRRARALSTFILVIVSLGQGQEKLSLAQAIEVALRQNPALEAARQEIGLASGRFWSEVSPSPPTLTLTREYIPAGRNAAQFQEQSVALNQNIDFPVSWYLKGEHLALSRRQAEARVQSSTVSLIASVKIAYFTARGCIDKLELAKENVSIARDFSRRAEIRFKTGEATHLEFQTSKVQYGQAQQALERASKEERVSRSRLLYLLGSKVEGSGQSSVSLDSLEYSPAAGTLEGHLATAGRINPQLSYQRSKSGAASASASLAWWNMMPAFSLSYLWQSRDGNSGYYGFGVGVSLPLWALFDHRGKIEEASAALRASEFELTNAENRIGIEIQQAWLDLKESEHLIELYVRDLLKQSEEVDRTARVSYSSGEITYLEYLQARQLLIQSRSEYIDALVQANASKAKLEEAVGKLPNE